MKETDEARQDLIVRLNKLTGQLGAVRRMIEADAPCVDVLRQVSAVNGALHRLSYLVLAAHAGRSVRAACATRSSDEPLASLMAALEAFAKLA